MLYGNFRPHVHIMIYIYHIVMKMAPIHSDMKSLYIAHRIYQTAPVIYA